MVAPNGCLDVCTWKVPPDPFSPSVMRSVVFGAPGTAVMVPVQRTCGSERGADPFFKDADNILFSRRDRPSVSAAQLCLVSLAGQNLEIGTRPPRSWSFLPKLFYGVFFVEDRP